MVRLAGGATAAVVIAGLLTAAPGAAAPRPPSAKSSHGHVHTRVVCGQVTGRRARCSAIQVLDPDNLDPAALAPAGRVKPAKKPTTTTASTTTSSSTTTSTTTTTTTTTTIPVVGACTTAHSGYTPCDLRSAYALTALTGGAQTVGIVDAYNDPNAESDLAVYRSAYGLAPCTTANKCFRKVAQNGSTKYPSANAGWADEISLDLDMVSAICPNCHILLVEATSNSLTNLLAAENKAAALGATVISNSWGAGEFSSETSLDSSFNHGIPITASTGDDGYGVSWPAASPYVTAVGGTALVPGAGPRGWSESAWSGAGSGCSAYEAKPAAQTDSGCTRRTVADVSAVADPDTGVATYDTYHESGWLVFGGTSVAAPIVASVYALAGNGATIATPAFAYAHTSALFDVASGSNGSCGGSYLCTAFAGYDGPTGLGTPNGAGGF